MIVFGLLDVKLLMRLPTKLSWTINDTKEKSFFVTYLRPLTVFYTKINKLERYGIRVKTHGLVKSYWNDKIQCVNLNRNGVTFGFQKYYYQDGNSTRVCARTTHFSYLYLKTNLFPDDTCLVIKAKTEEQLIAKLNCLKTLQIVWKYSR